MQSFSNKAVVFLLFAIFSAATACDSGNSGQEATTPHLRVERADCFSLLALYPDVQRTAEASSSPVPARATDSPYCSPVTAIGQEITLVALSETGKPGGEVIDRVAWVVDDPLKGTVSPEGVFSPLEPGTTEVRACVGEVCSDPYVITVVEDPRIVELYVSPSYPYDVIVKAFPAEIGVIVPDCIDLGCVVPLRLLVGTTANFYAHGILETGNWIDLTTKVAWHSSDPEVAALDHTGLLTALAEGRAEVSASYEELTSNKVPVEVVGEAVLVDVWIEKQTPAGVLKVGGVDRLSAFALYDPPMVSEVTGEVQWVVSDPEKVHIDADGLLTALAPGYISISAVYQGKPSSNEIELEIWDEVEISYCDPVNPNRAFWQDEYNRVILETDCASYQRQSPVTIRYTIEENQPHPWGVLDPCLDLVVLDASDTIVKTLRFEGCGDLPFAVERGQLEALDPIYMYSTVWDGTDDSGGSVGAGMYTIAGRFYIYYDPVIRVSVTLTE